MPAQNACASPPTEIRRRSLYADQPSKGRHAALRWTCASLDCIGLPLGAFWERLIGMRDMTLQPPSVLLIQPSAPRVGARFFLQRTIEALAGILLS